MAAVPRGNVPILSDFSPKLIWLVNFVLHPLSDSFCFRLQFCARVFFLRSRFMLNLVWIHTDLETRFLEKKVFGCLSKNLPCPYQYLVVGGLKKQI
jgi:hypothetical protein